MYWLSRPPVLRYALATTVVLTALWMEVRPTDAVMHPFAVHSIPAGRTVTPSDVEFRSVPAGLLPAVSLPQVTGHSVRAGDPILTAQSWPTTPAGWWALEMPSPAKVAPGSRVRVVITESDQPAVSTIGIVVDTGEAFGETTALVAVAEEWADTLAAAVREDRAMLMVSG